jgi:PEGA domain
VAAPNGSLSVNALPWAEVFIDGRSVGTTPLANLPVVIGSHEIVWRHPQLGERRRTIIVTAQEPVRVGQNFEP